MPSTPFFVEQTSASGANVASQPPSSAWSRIEPTRDLVEQTPWLPTALDQRHNLVFLLSGTLPRGFRLGLRFRLVSGNPQTPVVAVENSAQLYQGGWGYRPLYGVRGTTYAPLFHQLDLRVDKQWVRKRSTVTAYLDVQNVYDHRYPEVWVYSLDWSQRSALIGLPIFPSLGLQVDF